MMPLAQAQPAGMQAAFGKDAGTLSDKFTALARVTSGKYDWKPGQGVRSPRYCSKLPMIFLWYRRVPSSLVSAFCAPC